LGEERLSNTGGAKTVKIKVDKEAWVRGDIGSLEGGGAGGQSTESHSGDQRDSFHDKIAFHIKDTREGGGLLQKTGKQGVTS
jgi:hypothetical protein